MFSHEELTQDVLVYVVDDDSASRWALSSAVKLAGFQPQPFATAEAFLQVVTPDRSRPSCLLLDIRLPGLDGPGLQVELTQRGIPLPVIVISGFADVRTAMQMMRSGAIDLLEKPFSTDQLVNVLEKVIEQERERLALDARQRELQARLERLSPREQEVLEQLLLGKTNKLIAAALDIDVKTVARHKSRVLAKLGAKCDLEAILLLAGTNEVAFENLANS